MPEDPEPTSTETSFQHTQEQLAKQLLVIVIQLVQELRPGQKELESIGLDSDIDRELGLDSLARAELIRRVEWELKVNLPSQILASMTTPGELLKAVTQAQSKGVVVKSKPIMLAPIESLPNNAQTLQQVLDWHIEHHPDRPQLYVYNDASDVQPISYSQLFEHASLIAAGLIRRELSPGQSVAIMLPTCDDYFYCFFAVLLARGIPVPVYPPTRPSQLEDHLTRHARIFNNAQVSLLVTVAEAKGVSRLLRLQVPSIRHVCTVAQLRQAKAEPISVGVAKGDDIAFLQYTSGSTGDPKGVILTHNNLLANVRAMGRAVQADSRDVFVSWLPVYHDMGLIGAWFGSLYHAIPLVIMSPLRFLSKPQSWLWAIHQYRGTLSAAPNFAWELCLNKIDEAELEGLDLSCWRQAWNGAEPVSTVTMANFSQRFAKYGFRPEAMSPVYGLAECTVGLTFPAPGRLPVIDKVERKPLERYGLAVAAKQNDHDVINLAALGTPLAGHQIRIVDENGRELPERVEGQLEFKGESATQGYFSAPEKSKQLFHQDWLGSGDKGYMVGGELYLTGRSKDIIIRAGRNIYPHELEAAVSELAGIRKGCVAVFASADPQLSTEKLVVLAETREQDIQVRRRLHQAVNDLTLDLVGTVPDEIVLVAPHTVPKTSSGKIRRAASSELYRQGRLYQPQRGLLRQLLHVLLAGIKPQLGRSWRAATDLCYAGYLWLLITLLAPCVWSLVAMTQNAPICRAITRFAGEILRRLSVTGLKVEGMENLPANTPCVFTANHASYLDGLFLMLALPLDYRFIAKAELRNQLFPRIFLTRLGTLFVERFDVEKSIADAKRIADELQQRQSLFFFPEGTLYRMPGLHEFHLGAFMAAAAGHVPVVPVTLCGTRSKLRGVSLFPRRGDISVTIGKPIWPRGSDWQTAVSLRNQARAEILMHCNEPDLAGEQASVR